MENTTILSSIVAAGGSLLFLARPSRLLEVIFAFVGFAMGNVGLIALPFVRNANQPLSEQQQIPDCSLICKAMKYDANYLEEVMDYRTYCCANAKT